jgi:hypothetical protein
MCIHIHVLTKLDIIFKRKDNTFSQAMNYFLERFTQYSDTLDTVYQL